MHNFLFAVLSIACTVSANFILKAYSNSLPSIQIFGLYIGVSTLISLCLFGCAFIFYSQLVHLLPLNIANSVIQLQYIGIMLVSYFILSENMTWISWLGIFLIFIGILLVASQQQ